MSNRTPLPLLILFLSLHRLFYFLFLVNCKMTTSWHLMRYSNIWCASNHCVCPVHTPSRYHTVWFYRSFYFIFFGGGLSSMDLSGMQVLVTFSSLCCLAIVQNKLKLNKASKQSSTGEIHLGSWKLTGWMIGDVVMAQHLLLGINNRHSLHLKVHQVLALVITLTYHPQSLEGVAFSNLPMTHISVFQPGSTATLCSPIVSFTWRLHKWQLCKLLS